MSDGVISLKLEIQEVMLNVAMNEDNERFWSDLDEIVKRIPRGESSVGQQAGLVSRKRA